jgi:hypothetical protein
MVLTATPLARREEGKISDGMAHGMGPLKEDADKDEQQKY